MLPLDIEARVGFQFIAYSTKENGNPVRVCVKVTGEDTFCPISFDFRLSLSTLDGSAGEYFYSMQHGISYRSLFSLQWLPTIMCL